MDKIDLAKSKYLQVRRLLCEFELLDIEDFVKGHELLYGKMNPYLLEYLDSFNELANLLSDNELKIYIENSSKYNKLK